MHSDARELMAFMNALARNPRDMDTRRIFADWLEDHDEPELADQQRTFDPDKYDAEMRLRKFADRYAAGDYEGLLEGIRQGEYCFSDDGYWDGIDTQFWKDVSLILGKPITVGDTDLRDDTSFRCAC